MISSFPFPPIPQQYFLSPFVFANYPFSSNLHQTYEHKDDDRPLVNQQIAF